MSSHQSLLSSAEIIALNPADVFVPDRIGFYHEDKAIALGRLIAVDGQRDPIKVKARGHGEKAWELITGLHRLRGCANEEISVFALVVDGEAEDFADLEASENLHRRPLGPIERAKFTAALVQAAQDRIAREHGGLKQQQLAIKARWERVKAGETTHEQALRDETEDTCAKIAHVYGWEDSVGEALGLSRRTIHGDLSLFRLLIEPFPDLIEALAKHPVIGENASQLKAIAAVKDEAQRRQVIELVLDQPSISVDGARIRLGIDSGKAPAPTPDVKFTSTISDSWGRLSTTAKREYLPRFVTMLTPDMRSRLRELLDEGGS
ncbi:MAG: hypothetical protein OSA41_05620 [Erythrobacter sp.]|jgi:hypothetical protein|nr:hypothetical protein [Verrucomicrobiales bacterium]MDE0901176.1 hypothetical protein [Erythrobacter sp.]|tara:strand:- start:267774 stop:268736 length:963 start_codon:yes stop_codon:yes gene_type:complete